MICLEWCVAHSKYLTNISHFLHVADLFVLAWSAPEADAEARICVQVMCLG